MKKEKKESYSVYARLDKKTYEELAKRVNKEDRKRSYLVAQAVKQFLDITPKKGE